MHHIPILFKEHKNKTNDTCILLFMSAADVKNGFKTFQALFVILLSRQCKFFFEYKLWFAASFQNRDVACGIQADSTFLWKMLQLIKQHAKDSSVFSADLDT